MRATWARFLARTGIRAFWGSLDASAKRTLAMIILSVAALHALGFVVLIACTAGHHDPGRAGVLTIGLGVTAYTLGLRHAFDADHISAIDNTTRKLMAEGKRPLSVGFWFSLGHSTIVFALAAVISTGVRSIEGPVKNEHSTLHQATGHIGTAVSGAFLYVVAAVNLVILIGIVKLFREMRTGRYDEVQLERQLQSRGLMCRFFGRLTGAVTKSQHMYPIGALFGWVLTRRARSRCSLSPATPARPGCRGTGSFACRSFLRQVCR
jgi:high-affinity nickel-transport protein